MSVWFIISGGPAVFSAKDREHDVSWSNYVEDPLRKARLRTLHAAPGERIRWLIYRPGYEERWQSDVKRKADSTRRKSLAPGATDYVSHLQKKADANRWDLVWLHTADDFWSAVTSAGKGSISRVWYYGHAQEDLWLGVTRKGALEEVYASVRIRASTIDSAYAEYFLPAPARPDSKRDSNFWACNSASFAQEWSARLRLYAAGAVGQVSFKEIHKGQGILCTGACQWYRYAPGGRQL